MASNRLDDILKEIAQLPPSEQNRLRHLIDRRDDKASRDGRVATKPFPDSTRELQWLIDHAREYAGQWVALDGDRLIAHGTIADAVFDAAEADNARLPLVTFVEDSQKVYAGF